MRFWMKLPLRHYETQKTTYCPESRNFSDFPVKNNY